jgi:hypothetical protein
LIDAFLHGLCKESECEFCGLSHLLASLPDPSQILEDMLDGNEPAAGESESRQVAMDQEKIQQALTGDRNFSIACELGVRYPVLKAMLSRENLNIRTSVSHSYVWFMSFFYWYYTWYIYCIYIVYVEIIQSYM